MFPQCLFLQTCNKELMLLSVQHIVFSFTYKPLKTLPLLGLFRLMYSVGAATLPSFTSSLRPWHVQYHDQAQKEFGWPCHITSIVYYRSQVPKWQKL